MIKKPNKDLPIQTNVPKLDTDDFRQRLREWEELRIHFLLMEEIRLMHFRISQRIDQNDIDDV